MFSFPPFIFFSGEIDQIEPPTLKFTICYGDLNLEGRPYI